MKFLPVSFAFSALKGTPEAVKYGVSRVNASSAPLFPQKVPKHGELDLFHATSG